MRKSLKFAKDMSFMNLITELHASNVVLTLNAHQQSFTYVCFIIEECISFNVCFCSLLLFFCMLDVKSTKFLIT